MENLETDGQQPDCETCEYLKISEENQKILELYELSCSWDQLDFKGLEMALESHRITKRHHGKYQKKILAAHRIIKEHYANTHKNRPHSR